MGMVRLLYERADAFSSLFSRAGGRIRDDLLTGLVAFFFFFQAEDGIRDDLVTGVQTCALPIFFIADMATNGVWVIDAATFLKVAASMTQTPFVAMSAMKNVVPSGDSLTSCGRSEERRVGEEWRSRRAP